MMKNFTFWAALTGLLLLSLGIQAQIQVTFPTTRAVFQRNTANQATVRIAGLYTTAVNRIEARLTAINGGTGFDYRVIQNNPTGGSFTGELTGVTGGWYRLEVRAMLNDQQIGYTVLEPVGVGEVFVIAGQSNAQGARPTGLPANDDRVNAAVGTGQNESTADPAYPTFARIDNNMFVAPRGNGPYYWGRLGDLLVQRLGVPVMFFNVGWGATTVKNWRESAELGSTANVYSGVPLPPTMPYGNFKIAAQFYANMYGMRAVLWHQGEADNFVGTQTDQYSNDLLWLINRVRQETGKNVPWVVSRASFDSDLTLFGRASNPRIIAGQNAVINQLGGIFPGPTTDDFITTADRLDNTHFSDAGLAKVAAQWNTVLNDNFFTNAQPIAPAPLVTVSTGCPGDNQVRFSPNGQFPSVVWETINEQGIGTSSESGPSITKGSGPARFRAKVRDALGNVSYSSAVRVSDAPSVITSGPTTFCEGGAVNITANYDNNISFVNAVSNAVVGTNRTLSATTSGNYFARYRDVSGCDFNSSTVNVRVNSNPATPIVLADRPTTFCDGESTTLRVGVDNVRYNWNTGENSRSIDVRRTGAFQVSVTDQNGCTSPQSTAVNVVVNPNPATPTVAANGPTTFCADRNVTLTATESASYIWNTGSATRSILINQPGTYSLRVRNQFNCVSPESAAITVRVNPIPNAPLITATGQTTFCEGGQVTISSNSTLRTIWSSGDSTQTLVARVTSSYTARVRDQNGCLSPQSNVIAVTARPVPAAPTINQVGTFSLQALTNGNGNGNAQLRWYRNTDSLTVQSPVIKAAQSGSYRARNFIVYGPTLTCYSPFSPGFAYTVDQSFNGMSVYPNPSPTQQVTVETLENIQNATVTVYTLLGQKALEFTVPSFSERQLLNLTTIPAGQYLLQVQSAGFNASKRILVGF
jgi:hypothetical protein